MGSSPFLSLSLFNDWQKSNAQSRSQLLAGGDEAKCRKESEEVLRNWNMFRREKGEREKGNLDDTPRDGLLPAGDKIAAIRIDMK